MQRFYFNTYIHHFILFLAALVFAYSLDISMIDDGLRHISFAYNKEIMKSWGEIFPYSLFGDYDPWFMWHNLLFVLSKVISFEKIHLVVNTFSLYFLMVLIAEHLNKEIKYDFSSLIYIVIFSIAVLTSHRYIMLRPDLLSGLFIMAALLFKNRFLPVFILTIFYGPFYYLFFMYTGSIGLVYLIQKKFKAFLGVLLGSILTVVFYMITNFQEYLRTIVNILTDQKLRMGLEVNEGKPIFDFLSNFNYFFLFVFFFIISLSIIYLKYNYFKENSIALFLLITSILWVNQLRYFDLFFPIVLIFLVSIFFNLNKKHFLYKIRKYGTITKHYFNYSKKTWIFYIIAIPYAIFIFSLSFNSHSLNKELEEATFFKNNYYDNKTILFNSLSFDIYKALYYNPTIKTVPSCSVGWFDDKDKNMKDIYIRMQKDSGVSENELYTLIKYINADLYIHELRNTKQILDFKKLEELGIIPKEIFQNRIIFEIRKN